MLLFSLPRCVRIVTFSLGTDELILSRMVRIPEKRSVSRENVTLNENMKRIRKRGELVACPSDISPAQKTEKRLLKVRINIRA